MRRKQGRNPCFTEFLSNDLKQVGGRQQLAIKFYNNACLRISLHFFVPDLIWPSRLIQEYAYITEIVVNNEI